MDATQTNQQYYNKRKASLLTRLRGKHGQRWAFVGPMRGGVTHGVLIDVRVRITNLLKPSLKLKPAWQVLGQNRPGRRAGELMVA